MGRIWRRLSFGTAIVAFCALVVGTGQAQAGTWDDLAWMYQPSEVVKIHLTLDDDQKALIDQEDGDWVSGVGFWMEGSAGRTFGSVESPWRIEARLKGNTSFRFLDEKAAFNLKLPSGSRPNGLKRMTLNNMVQDPSYLRETTAYEVFRANDLPAPRTGYAQLWVNDEYYGLYLNLEKYNDQALDHWFPSMQHLFENATIEDLLRTGDLLKEDFEVDEGDEEDWSDLELLTAAVRTGDWNEIVGHLADSDRTLRLLAAEWYIGHWDGYSWAKNNYYLHSDDGGLFSMLPSGTDQTFRTPPRANFDLSFPLASAVDTWNPPRSGGPPRGAGALVDACVADPVCSDEFIHEIENVRRIAAELDIEARVADRATALDPLIESDPRGEYSASQIAGAQNGIGQFLEARDGQLEVLLRTHPLTAHTPTISDRPNEDSTTTVATFSFGEGEDESVGVTGFECSLDQDEFTACASPITYKRLTAGNHRFEVRATNEGDTPSPAVAHVWNVTPNRHVLTIDRTGDGSGSVSTDLEGPEYDEGTDVTLTGVPAAQSTFEGWLGCDTETSAGDCIVTMDEARSVTADFARVKQPGMVGRITAPAKGAIKVGDKRVVKVRIRNVGDEPVATTLWATSSNQRVRVNEAYEVTVQPREVEVVEAQVKASKTARGKAKLTFLASGVRAVTFLTVKKPRSR